MLKITIGLTRRDWAEIWFGVTDGIKDPYWGSLCSRAFVTGGGCGDKLPLPMQCLLPYGMCTHLASDSGLLQRLSFYVQHYSEEEGALNAIKCLPVLEELDSDLNLALDSLASSKAPGKDSIPAEVLKCWKGNISASLSCMKSLVSAAEKVKYHKTWGTQTSSHCTRTKAIEVTASNYRGISLQVSSLYIIYMELFTINPTYLHVGKLIEAGQSHKF